MRFVKWNHTAGLESDYVHMHIVTHIGLLGESGGCPDTISTGHLNGVNFVIAGDKRFGRINTVYKLISFTNPMEFNVLVAIVFQRPLTCRW